jgi:NAD(P)H-dependent flavin oxidoreductase YrpB (nitropropane dioxygenase family)
MLADSWIILGLLVFALLAILAIKLKLVQNQKEQTSQYPYQKIDGLFSPAERLFLSFLRRAVTENIQVFGKVRVADVIAPKKGLSSKDWQKAFNKISAKHFDFVLCEKNDLSIICAIELDDKSHQTKRRQERDAFLETACQSAGVPLVRFKAKATYNLEEIKTALPKFIALPEIVTNSEKFRPINEDEDETTEKICPKCSSKMVKRKAKQGPYAGKLFWGCSTYPRCKHIEPIHT